MSQADSVLPSDILKTQTLARLALIGGILCIGFSAIFVRLSGARGEVAAFWRMLFGTLLLTGPFIWRLRSGRARLPRRALAWGMLGGVAIAADLALWHTSLLMTGAGVATLLDNTAPLWVALGAWILLGERLRPLYWIGLAVALGGAAIIVGFDALAGLGTNPGNGLALLAAVAYAAYQLITKRGRQEIDAFSYLYLMTVSACAVLLVTSLAMGSPLGDVTPRGFLMLAALALVTHTTGWTLLSFAFGHVRASVMTISLLGQPIVTTIAAWPILGEIPAPWQLTGGAVTLAGIAIVHLSTNGSKDAAA